MTAAIKFEIVDGKREEIRMVCSENYGCTHHNIKCRYPHCEYGIGVRIQEREARAKRAAKRKPKGAK